ATDWYDNRQPWQELSSDQVRLHYYGMDATFAATILASAQGTIGDLERTYAVPRSQTLAIWVYPEATAFREGLPANFRESVVGGSVVGYPLIVAVIPPGSDSEVGRIIPHEISHQVLYQATRNPFGLTPTWFDEGMATHAQIGGTSGFMGMVVAANQRDGLLELDSLAGSFPYSPSQASLAYAESWSVIAFIESRWGAEGITALIHAFAEGLPTDGAISTALGLSMDAFTADWKSWIASQS
ncbi:MAG: peptidase MA family metallohydrolase, partial [Thermomicrobiales bacterium]